jgi:uncharacterized protein YeaC (DUF1315 family)
MDYQQMIRELSPQMVARLKRALELGKWPDGQSLNTAQREDTMQAVIAWDAMHLPEGQRVGHIDRRDKGGDSCDDPEETPLNWINKE